MKIFGVLFFLLLLFIGTGFYRGWFAMSSKNGSPENRKVDVNLTVDPDKMEADAGAVKSVRLFCGALSEFISGAVH